MKILHTSDWHVGRTIRGRSRAEEHREVLAEIASIAADRAVDLVVMAGDVFDTATPTAESERIVYRALLDLADVAPVVIVAGNHDNRRRLEAVAPLLELGRVIVRGEVRRPDDGGVVEVAGLGVRVATVPWLSQRGIVSAADLVAKDADQHAADYAGRVRDVVAALCQGMTPDTVNLVVAHLSVQGAETTGSERAMHTVLDYTVPALAFPGELHYVALGHYHRVQKVPAPAPTWYSGSPLQLDFGETGDRKAVLVVEAEPGLPATVEEVPLASGRRLIRLVGTLEQVTASAGDLPDDAYVKVELEEAARVGLADEVREAIPGVVDVVLARREQPTRTDPVPNRLGRPPAELFAEYLADQGVEDERLLDLFGELAEELHEA